MKKYLISLAILIAFHCSNAQLYKVKTIYELLNIKPSNCVIPKVNNEEGQVVMEAPNYRREKIHFSLNDLTSNEEAIKNHFLKNKNREILFTKMDEFYGIGNTQILKKGNQYKLVDQNGKVLLNENFEYILKHQGHNYGFNAYKKGTKSLYYKADGTLLFNNLFDFVDREYDGYFTIFNNGKFGVADSKGNLVFPAKYKSVSSISKTKNNLFFLVTDNDSTYFISTKNKRKFNIKNYSNYPYILDEKIWCIDGKVYNIEKMQILFCEIKENIEVYDIKRKLLKIRKENGMTIIFDLQGNLQTKQEIYFLDYLENNKSLALILEEDNKPNVILKTKTGIFNNATLQWESNPTYSFMKVIDTNYFLFKTANTNKNFGIVDKNNNVIIDENKYDYIVKTSIENEFLCNNTENNYSTLFNVKTKKITKLNYECIAIEKSETPNYYIATFSKNNTYIKYFLNENLEEVKLPKFKSIFFDNRTGLYECKLKLENDNYYNQKNIYLNKNLIQTFFDINGKMYENLQYIRPLSSNARLLEIDENNYYLDANNKMIKVNENNIFHDTLLNFIVINHGGTYGLADMEWNTLLPTKFNYISYNYFSDYIFVNVKDNIDYIIDKNGKILFNGKYESTKLLVNNCFMVKSGMYYGVVNNKDEIIIPIEHKFMDWDYGGLRYGNDFNNFKFLPQAYFNK